MVASNAWLKRGDLFQENEGFMLALQDQVIDTKNYQKYIIRRPNINDTCRHCRSSPETIQHISGACKSIAQTNYKHRHDQLAAIIHQNLAFQYKLRSEKVPYYKYQPQSVLENNSYKVYWDRTKVTDKTIYNNRPDLEKKINQFI
ncbi:jg15198 [Pararge aegeria aegeria]|uniref:Jg15198 protein n=1 Tax=Pararge aegeria aegeria TaxID=348720 RepID=A0A8S4QVV6_9NEOP|nr:jg15198 [Pararge aegeria aegeria]